MPLQGTNSYHTFQNNIHMMIIDSEFRNLHDIMKLLLLLDTL